MNRSVCLDLDLVLVLGGVRYFAMWMWSTQDEEKEENEVNGRLAGKRFQPSSYLLQPKLICLLLLLLLPSNESLTALHDGEVN